MPVPTVTYSAVSSPWAAPHCDSARMAAFTSVSNATGTLKARRIVPARSMFRQPSLGVDVMKPYVEDAGFRSIGPNDPIPNAEIGCPQFWKKAMASAIVSAGDLVGMRMELMIDPEFVPMAQTNLVPPASIAPKALLAKQWPSDCGRLRHARNIYYPMQ